MTEGRLGKAERIFWNLSGLMSGTAPHTSRGGDRDLVMILAGRAEELEEPPDGSGEKRAWGTSTGGTILIFTRIIHTLLLMHSYHNNVCGPHVTDSRRRPCTTTPPRHDDFLCALYNTIQTKTSTAQQSIIAIQAIS